jgi:NADH:ubiquinone oxidoreductase subunit E
MAYDATFHRSVRTLEDEGPPFVYTAENRARFDEIVTRYPPEQRRSAVLPALYLAQHQHGYITANAIRYVAGLLGLTPAEVEDVVSFYTMFYTKPVGQFVLQVCRTLSCALNGAERGRNSWTSASHAGRAAPLFEVGALRPSGRVAAWHDADRWQC